MSSLGKIEEFDPASTNISRYLERLAQYFIANGVPADKGERAQSNSDLCHRFQSLRCPLGPMLTRNSFGENLR